MVPLIRIEGKEFCWFHSKSAPILYSDHCEINRLKIRLTERVANNVSIFIKRILDLGRDGKAVFSKMCYFAQMGVGNEKTLRIDPKCRSF